MKRSNRLTARRRVESFSSCSCATCVSGRTTSGCNHVQAPDLPGEVAAAAAMDWPALTAGRLSAQAAGTLHRQACSWSPRAPSPRALVAAPHHAHPEHHQLPGGCTDRGLVAPLVLCAGLFVQQVLQVRTPLPICMHLQADGGPWVPVTAPPALRGCPLPAELCPSCSSRCIGIP